MPLIKLIGLTLFVTAVFLLMIAAITKTTHLEFQSGGGIEVVSGGAPINVPVDPNVPNAPTRVPTNNSLAQETSLVSVPILWPLALAAGAGLLVWFAVPDSSPSRSKRGSARGSAIRKRRSR